MARQAKIQILQGTTAKPTRDYLQVLFNDLHDRYDRLYVPCAGRFTIPQVARAAGWQPSSIIASDISLYSSLVGYYIAGRDLVELKIEFADTLSHLEEHRGKPTFAAACLWGMKWAQFAAGKTYYMQSLREELEASKEAYIAAFRARLIELSASLGKIQYRIAGLFAEMKEAADDGSAIVYLDPPTSKDGNRKISPVFEHMRWADPAIPEFDPKADFGSIIDYARSAKALTMWYRVGSVPAAEMPYVTFGAEQRANNVDYQLMARPSEGTVAVQNRKITQVNPKDWPLLLPDQTISATDTIKIVMVTREIALYLRDLWAHKLGTVRAERYVGLLINSSKIWGSIGMNLSDANARRVTSTGTNVFELYGFNAPSQYKRLNTLLMMCLTCEQFRDDLVNAEPALAWVGGFGFSTTCISDVPEMKANRGLLKLTGRSRLPNGKYKLLYNTRFHKGTYADMLTRWLAKDGKLLWT